MSPKRPFALLAVTFIFLSLSLAPSMTHLIELPAKMQLNHDEYFIAQQIYQDWSWSGLLIGGAMLSTLWLSISTRHDHPQLSARALFAFLCLTLTQIIFWNMIYPINVATQNWMIQVADWEALRLRWEYSYALNAGILFVAQLIIFSAAFNSGRFDNDVDEREQERYKSAA